VTLYTHYQQTAINLTATVRSHDQSRDENLVTCQGDSTYREVAFTEDNLEDNHYATPDDAVLRQQSRDRLLAHAHSGGYSIIDIGQNNHVPGIATIEDTVYNSPFDTVPDDSVDEEHDDDLNLYSHLHCAGTSGDSSDYDTATMTRMTLTIHNDDDNTYNHCS
jgi:hypothetical protein